MRRQVKDDTHSSAVEDDEEGEKVLGSHDRGSMMNVMEDDGSVRSDSRLNNRINKGLSRSSCFNESDEYEPGEEKVQSIEPPDVSHDLIAVNVPAVELEMNTFDPTETHQFVQPPTDLGRLLKSDEKINSS